MSRALPPSADAPMLQIPPTGLALPTEVAPDITVADPERGLEPLHLLVPWRLPQLHGFELAGCCHPSQPVGGDFYDVMSTPSGRFWLVIADVMGKGMAAALLAATVRGLGRMLIRMGCTPSTLLGQLNETLFDELAPSGTFVTAQAALVDVHCKQILLASAGHCPLLTVSKEGGISSFSAEGLPLGVFAETSFQETALDLDAIRCLLLHTDGVTDAVSPAGESYGLQRLGTWLANQSVPGCSAVTLKETLKVELETFQAGNSLRDDQTFLFLSRSSGSNLC